MFAVTLTPFLCIFSCIELQPDSDGSKVKCSINFNSRLHLMIYGNVLLIV